MLKNNLKKLLFPIISLFVVLLLIASSFTSIVDLYRPPIKDSVMKSQIPKNKKVTVNLSQTEFKEQAEEAINSWNSDRSWNLFWTVSKCIRRFGNSAFFGNDLSFASMQRVSGTSVFVLFDGSMFGSLLANRSTRGIPKKH